MNDKQKPELSLIRGDKAQKTDTFIALFEMLKGRPATEQEIEVAKAWKPKEMPNKPRYKCAVR